MRLIDADALVNKDFTMFWNDVFDERVFKSIIKTAPTVDIKTEVAREIIGEIWSSHTPDIDGFFTMHENELVNLKDKYTKEGVGE